MDFVANLCGFAKFNETVGILFSDLGCLDVRKKFSVQYIPRFIERFLTLLRHCGFCF